MKTKHYARRVAALVIIIVVLLAVTLIDFTPKREAVPVTVSVLCDGQPLTVNGNDDMTVKQLLQTAEIAVGDRDEVKPPADMVWREAEATSITISHYAKVTVIYDGIRKEVELMGGTVSQAITQAGYNPAEFSADMDVQTLLKDGMEINLTKPLNGPVTIDGKTYYYADGVMQTSTVVQTDSGNIYVGPDGIADMSCCSAVSINGEDWNVINGVPTKVESEYDKTLHRALEAVAQCTNSEMTKEQKIRSAYEYIQTNYLEGVPHDPPYIEEDWPIVCANDIFVGGKGDCFSYGAAFAFMLKALGCSDVYACNSGGHGWAEAESLVYDPEWGMHSNNYPYFAMTYDEECDVNYSTVLDGSEWKRKPI